MGIKVEFNPDLALRNISEYKKGNRKIEECIPEILKVGKVYNFLKNDQRNYWLQGEIPLLETKGNEKLSRPNFLNLVRSMEMIVVHKSSLPNLISLLKI